MSQQSISSGSSGPIYIRWKLNDMLDELHRTSDPLEKLMVGQLIRLKKQQMQKLTEHTGRTGDTDSIDSLSADDVYDLDSDNSDSRNDKSKTSKSVKSTKSAKSDKSAKSTKSDKSNKSAKPVKSKQIAELDELERIKKDSLKQINKQNKKKIREDAYKEMIDEQNRDDDVDLSNQRTDRFWPNKDLADPNYARYIKEDRMNNQLMERLNSEIDFRMSGPSKRIIKAFEN